MSAQSVPALRLAGVEVELGGRRLLGPLDLELAYGEHALLVGASGSGKTTLLRAIAGLQPLAAGRIELDGRATDDGPRQLVPPRARRIGFLFQGGALWPHMSARKTLLFTLRAAGVPRGEREARARELLAAVELAGFGDRLPSTLSGGEKQRLALARALAPRPHLLLLDEPLGPLDAPLRGALLDRLAALRDEQGFTAVHVTHDPEESGRVATRTLLLEGGRLFQPEVAP